MIRVPVLIGVLGILLCHSAWADERGAWIAAWTSSPTGPADGKPNFGLPLPSRVTGTIRFRIRLSQGGRRVRLRLSNEGGREPLEVRRVSIGVAMAGLDAAPASLRRVTFAGQDAVTIPAGAPVLSDGLDEALKPLRDVVVSLYFAHAVPITDLTNVAPSVAAGIADDIDATLMEHMPSGRSIALRPMVSMIDVWADHSWPVVVALGDSITDGVVDPATGDRGWPGELARRLQGKASVVNAGIGGNRLLQSAPLYGESALGRLDRDVFAVPGVSHLIVLEGINDIGFSGLADRAEGPQSPPLVRPEELIAALCQIAARAHERGIKVFVGTLLPFEGASAEGDYYSQKKEETRSAVNEWIRTSKAFDGVIDFDAALRDPHHPRMLGAQYDDGGHLHPNAAGYRKMGDVIDLRNFK